MLATTTSYDTRPVLPLTSVNAPAIRPSTRATNCTVETAGLRQLIYLGGLGDDSPDLSPHLRSRTETGVALASGSVPVTTLRAGISGCGTAGLAAVHTGEGAADTVLVEVALPRQIRSQQDAYRIHPALLDACFQSVAAHPAVQALGEDVLALPLGIRRLRAYGMARTARYCYTRVTKADTSGVEADLDVLDEQLVGAAGEMAGDFGCYIQTHLAENREEWRLGVCGLGAVLFQFVTLPVEFDATARMARPSAV